LSTRVPVFTNGPYDHSLAQGAASVAVLASR
jgi:hypothetical protein